MRLLHTSDWHLGRSLLGLPLLEDQQVFCEHLVELVHDFRPDLVIIVGDLFERSTPSEEALQILDQLLQRLLLDCKVKVLLLPGQQDGVQRLSFASWLYEKKQLHLVTTLEQALSPILMEDADGPVHINAIPFLRVEEVNRHFRTQNVTSHGVAGHVILEHLTRFRRLRRRSVRGLVAGYLWVEGGLACGEERPLDTAVATEAFEAVNYAALGYLHRHQSLGPENQLCYSGSPFAFQFESDPIPRGVVKVDLNAAGTARSELVPFPARRHFYRFSGSLERLLLGPPRILDPDDLVVLELSQDSDLLSADLILRLRNLYPNLWRIERPEIQQRLGLPKLGEAVSDFSQFFQSSTGEVLEGEVLNLLRDVFQEVEE